MPGRDERQGYFGVPMLQESGEAGSQSGGGGGATAGDAGARLRIEAGYADEMAAVRAAMARRNDAAMQGAMTERWLGDVTLYGSAKAVRDGVEAWQATGVKTVSLVPSSTRGGQMVAFEELIAAYR